MHFEITGYPCNLIGSQWCDLFTNRTIFCSKSHLFLSQWELDSKTKQPIRFQGSIKVINKISGKWKAKSHCMENFATTITKSLLLLQFFFKKLCDFLNFVLCNFDLKSYLSFQIELALRARSLLKSHVWFQTKLHSTQFNYRYKSTCVLWRMLFSDWLRYTLSIRS